VRFDEPQRDAEDDGPYREAEIEAEASDLISPVGFLKLHSI